MSGQGEIIVLDLPGAFDSYFSGSSVGQGQVETAGYPRAKETYEAYKRATRFRRGKGYIVRLVIPKDVAQGVLYTMWEYCDACLVANSDEPQYSEVSAAKRLLERIQKLQAENGWPHNWQRDLNEGDV